LRTSPLCREYGGRPGDEWHLPDGTLALGRWTVAAALLLPLVWPCLRRASLDRHTLTTLA
jgi:ABC-type Co2+ transport system permease subunit